MPDDLPDYLLYVTRHSLLGFTTALNDVSSDMHAFFVRLNYAFAVERMMRAVMFWGMPGSMAQPQNLAVLQSWFPVAQPQPKLLPYRGAGEASRQPSKRAEESMQDAGKSFASACTAMMSIPAAMFTAAPAVMDAWGTGTPAA